MYFKYEYNCINPYWTSYWRGHSVEVSCRQHQFYRINSRLDINIFRTSLQTAECAYSVIKTNHLKTKRGKNMYVVKMFVRLNFTDCSKSFQTFGGMTWLIMYLPYSKRKWKQHFHKKDNLLSFIITLLLFPLIIWVLLVRLLHIKNITQYADEPF